MELLVALAAFALLAVASYAFAPDQTMVARARRGSWAPLGI